MEEVSALEIGIHQRCERRLTRRDGAVAEQRERSRPQAMLSCCAPTCDTMNERRALGCAR
jgi:hypothetical protein